MICGGVLADLVGIRDLCGGIIGEDPYTLQKWRMWERVVHGVGGGIQLVATAAAISSMVSRIVSPCGDTHWRMCFTEDMALAVPVHREIAAAASEEADARFSAFWLLSAAGAVVIAKTVKRSDERKRRRRGLELVDDTFANDLLDDLFGPKPLPGGLRTAPSIARSASAEFVVPVPASSVQSNSGSVFQRASGPDRGSLSCFSQVFRNRSAA